MESYLVGISTYGLLVYCELELKIHNCHSVNTSFIIIIEEVLKLLFLLQRGGKATQRGAPLLIPIEWLINLPPGLPLHPGPAPCDGGGCDGAGRYPQRPAGGVWKGWAGLGGEDFS